MSIDSNAYELSMIYVSQQGQVRIVDRPNTDNVSIMDNDNTILTDRQQSLFNKINYGITEYEWQPRALKTYHETAIHNDKSINP
jgi:hypothetical protein